ncbi:MAG: hypothetical protein DMG11_01340 [Acidobacteria bacterium]|nr:MAG: hypothetical protein DMG11_01340 [Acidobacteriota bacterium]
MCSSCHSSVRDLNGVGRKSDATALRAQILKPKGLDAEQSFKIDRLHDTKVIAARDRHRALLENNTTEQVINLVAYLQNLK